MKLTRCFLLCLTFLLAGPNAIPLKFRATNRDMTHASFQRNESVQPLHKSGARSEPQTCNYKISVSTAERKCGLYESF